jgi:uncharacterized protein YqiB (DUF1249 family)
MTACKYWDCGWCYAPNYLKTNAINSTCVDPNKCPISPLSEPTQYETPMTEIQKVKAEIKVLEKKLSFLEELEKTKSPVEEAFKRVYGYYPEVCEGSVWIAFQKGYDAAYEEKVVEEPIKKKSLYQFLAEWKYGIEEGDNIPQFDNDEFSVLDWSHIFIEYLYEWGDIISVNEDEIVIKFKQTQLVNPDD